MAVRKRLPTFTENDIPKADVFTARGIEFVIPGANVGGIPFRQKIKKAKVKDDFKWVQIKSVFTKFWSKFCTRIWFLFVEALWIPSYRPEWGKYKTWKYSYGRRKKSKAKKPKVEEYSSGDTMTDYEEEHRKASLRKSERRFTINSILEHRATKQASAHKIVPHDSKGCEIIRFNITGLIYETERRTLNAFPDTLLGNSSKLSRYWDPTREEYFFDRHRRSFEAILYYFQSGGTLIRPQDISLPVFEDEVKFYELGPNVLMKFLRDEGIMTKDDLAKTLPNNLLLRKLWFLIEYPESSTQAQITALFSVFVVILSTVIFCLETLPVFSAGSDQKLSKMKDPFFLTESVCVIWFTFEVIIRLVTCPQKLSFLLSPMNIVDIISIIPFYVTVFTPVAPEIEEASNEKRRDASTTLVTLRIFRLFRVFRIFKLSRHSAGLQILGKTLRASMRELLLLVFFLLICVVIFASLVYFAEIAEESKEFSSIPDAFWWGIVTMTSLGYGDKIPQSVGGRLVGGLCAVAAVLTLSLPIPETASHVQGCSHLPSCPVLIAYDDESLNTRVDDPRDEHKMHKIRKRKSHLSAPVTKTASSKGGENKS